MRAEGLGSLSQRPLTLVTESPSVLSKVMSTGLNAPGQLLASPDLAAYFKLSRDVQERIRSFFEQPVEVSA